jgi:membrane-anchored protein YejM (alkaline phosphatase superfamily)
LQDESPTLPELIRPVPSVQVLALYGLGRAQGVGRGFTEELKARRDYGYARDVMRRLLDRLERVGPGGLFAYAHFIDTHAPYSRGGKTGSPFERYVKEVATIDREIGRLRRFLEQKALAKRTVLIVSADHGEAFGEHGMRYHARSVYEELLQVPLMIDVPGAARRRVEVPVTLMDLGPTVLDLLGKPTPGSFMGESLLPLMAGSGPPPTRPIVADAGRRMQAFFAPNDKKVIFDLRRGTTEVYDLARDPEERRNLADDPNEDVVAAITAARYFFRVHTLSRAGWEPPWRKF